jgi:hypothetical protein
MNASRTKEALAGLLGTGSVHEDELVGMAFSVSRDGGSSEIRISTVSTQSATKLLDAARAILERLSKNQKTVKLVENGLLSVDANDTTVALRARVPFAQLGALLAKLQPRRPPQP